MQRLVPGLVVSARLFHADVGRDVAFCEAGLHGGCRGRLRPATEDHAERQRDNQDERDAVVHGTSTFPAGGLMQSPGIVSCGLSFKFHSFAGVMRDRQSKGLAAKE